MLKRINSVYFLADDFADLEQIKNPNMGTECFVITEACEYRATSDGRWIKQIKPSGEAGGNVDIDLSKYVTKEEYDNQMIRCDHFIQSMQKHLDYIDATSRPIKYEIGSLPEGAIVDYRDKEIRVFCPADSTVWKKQSVGANGSANMYYMGFKAYAPAGATHFKEGDRGVIVDELFDFKGDFAGTDSFGRNYSICWLALASYDEVNDKWTYYGATSNNDKYIGWTYIVEWYDKNGKLIDTDKVRINLSNENCHLTLAPYYGTV